MDVGDHLNICSLMCSSSYRGYGLTEVSDTIRPQIITPALHGRRCALCKTKECIIISDTETPRDRTSHKFPSTLDRQQTPAAGPASRRSASPAERRQETHQLESGCLRRIRHAWMTHPNTCRDGVFDHSDDWFNFQRRNEFEMSVLMAVVSSFNDHLSHLSFSYQHGRS